MSKAQRLKALKQKELEKNKKEREKEDYLKKNFKQSKTGKKYRKAPKEPVYYPIIKILMIIPFLYSGFFYGGIAVINIYKNMINVKTSVATLMLISLIVMVVSIILAFKRKYIISFGLSLISTLVYFYLTYKNFVEYATGKTLENDLYPERKYMKWYYPILIFLLFSLILLILDAVKRIKKRRKERLKKDNAPVKSIVD